MAPNKFATIPNSPNLQRAFQLLTDGTMNQWSRGKIPKMNPVQAAGFLGALTHEHGRWDWNNLDVIEKGSGRGRGVGQFTDNWDGSAGRRTAYEAARRAAVGRGDDPNSIDFQFRYIAEEYDGKWDHTVGGKSLAGWTRVFEKLPSFKNVQEAVMYYTGSADEGKGYLRPKKATAHYDRRIDAATQILKHQSAPKPQAQAQPKGQEKSKGNNWLQETLNKLGIKGGNQSFDTNKLQKNLGSIAANTPVSDVGFAIFASQKGVGNASKAWKKLDNNTKRAYGRAGGQLAINSNPGGSQQTYKMPKNLSIGSGSQNYAKDSKIDFERNKTQSGGPRSIGGLPGLNDIAQAGIANYGHFKDKSAGYGAAAYGMSNSTVGRINSQSYSSKMDLGRSLGINTGATSAAGSRYGGAAMSSGWNASATAAAGYGYSK